MPLVKGTASVDDTRAHAKAMRGTKFPKCFSQEVTISKVNRQVMAQWIEQKVTQLLGFEDEIVQGTAVNLFLPSPPEDAPLSIVQVDPKKAQIDLQGFLGEEEGAQFCKEVWELLLDAQESPVGIPKSLLEEKKKEMAKERMRQQQQEQRSIGGRGNQIHQERRRDDSASRPVRPVSPPHDYNGGPRGDDRRSRRDFGGSAGRDGDFRRASYHGDSRPGDRRRWDECGRDRRHSGGRSYHDRGSRNPESEAYDSFGRRRFTTRGDNSRSYGGGDRYDSRGRRRDNSRRSSSRSRSRSISPDRRGGSRRRYRSSSVSESSSEGRRRR